MSWRKIITTDPDAFVLTLNDLNIKPNDIIKFGSVNDIRIGKAINTFLVYVEEKEQKPKKERKKAVKDV